MFSTKFNSKNDAKLCIIFIHGWGNTHLNMLQLATTFANQTENYGVDLIGCGKSPLPTKIYSTNDYANDLKEFIKTLPQDKKKIIVGHSNGGRIAIKLAKERIVDAIVLLGGAGIPPKKTIFSKLYLFFVKKLSFFKKIFPFLTKIVGSKDYRNTSGIMRDTFKQLISEDLRNDAKQVEIPTLLLYGDFDTATPVWMGKEYNNLIKNSQLITINGANHYDLITNSIKMVHHNITKFIRELK